MGVIQTLYRLWYGTPATIPSRKVSSDFTEHPTVHRDVLYAACGGTVVLTPHLQPATIGSNTAADPACQFPRGGASTLRMRIFAIATGAETCTVAVYGFHNSVNIGSTSDSAVMHCTGQKLASLTCTFGGPQTAGVHPVTGEKTNNAAGASATWYQASAIVVTTVDADIVKELGSDETTSGNVILIDMIGFDGIYCEPATPSASTCERVVVEVQRLM